MIVLRLLRRCISSAVESHYINQEKIHSALRTAFLKIETTKVLCVSDNATHRQGQSNTYDRRSWRLEGMQNKKKLELIVLGHGDQFSLLLNNRTYIFLIKILG
jgi:hypothetical protein